MTIYPLSNDLGVRRPKPKGYRIYVDKYSVDWCPLCRHYGELVYVMGMGNYLRCKRCLMKVKERDKNSTSWIWMKADKLYFEDYRDRIKYNNYYPFDAKYEEEVEVEDK